MVDIADGTSCTLVIDVYCWILNVRTVPKNRLVFVVLSKRWLVERTFGWFNWWRRLSKDYEVLPLLLRRRLFMSLWFVWCDKLLAWLKSLTNNFSDILLARLYPIQQRKPYYLAKVLALWQKLFPTSLILARAKKPKYTFNKGLSVYARVGVACPENSAGEKRHGVAGKWIKSSLEWAWKK